MFVFNVANYNYRSVVITEASIGLTTIKFSVREDHFLLTVETETVVDGTTESIVEEVVCLTTY